MIISFVVDNGTGDIYTKITNHVDKSEMFEAESFEAAESLLNLMSL